jgi:hypothetical protein
LKRQNGKSLKINDGLNGCFTVTGLGRAKTVDAEDLQPRGFAVLETTTSKRPRMSPLILLDQLKSAPNYSKGYRQAMQTMKTSDSTLDLLTRIISQKYDVQTLVEDIRLTRIRLGTALERLEDFVPDQDGLDELRYHAESVAIETQHLNESLRRMMGA